MWWGFLGSEWDEGELLHGTLSSDPTSPDTNDDVDNNDDGTPCDCSDAMVFSTSVTLGDGEPLAESPDNDSVTADPNENLTVDFGFYRPVFDLALRKAAQRRHEHCGLLPQVIW